MFNRYELLIEGLLMDGMWGRRKKFKEGGNSLRTSRERADGARWPFTLLLLVLWGVTSAGQV